MKVNKGFRRIYNYYNNYEQESKVDAEILNNWMPKSPTVIEFMILSKLNDLCNERDGISCSLKSDVQVTSLFMTSNDEYTVQDAIKQAVSRFNSMKVRGLVEGNNVYSPVITLVGRQRLENIQDNKNECLIDIQKSIDELKTICENQNDNMSAIYEQICNIDVSGHLTNKSSAKDVITFLCTIIQGLGSITPAANVVSKIFKTGYDMLMHMNL